MGQSDSKEPFYTEEEKQRIYKDNPWMAAVAGMYLTKKAVEHDNPVVKVAVTQPLEELGDHTVNFSRHAWNSFWGLFGLGEKGAELADATVASVGSGATAITWLLDHDALLWILGAAGAVMAYKAVKSARQ